MSEIRKARRESEENKDIEQLQRNIMVTERLMKEEGETVIVKMKRLYGATSLHARWRRADAGPPCMEGSEELGTDESIDKATTKVNRTRNGGAWHEGVIRGVQV